MPIHSLSNAWVLETRASAYAFGLNAAGLLAHRYWGARLPYVEDYPPPSELPGWASFNGPAQVTPEEYPACGGLAYVEPCLKVSLADGAREARLRFAGAETRPGPDPELVIELREALAPLSVELHYRIYEDDDLIERWAELVNRGDQPILIERAFSAQWHLPPGEGYRLTHLSGRWLDEGHLRHEPLLQGVKVLESRRLTTGHHHSPWFAIDRGTAGEQAGEVWAGTLAWSGNWKLAAETTDFASTRVGIGINDWDFAWRLAPGERFVTPPSLALYTQEGFGGASQRFHDYTRQRLLPHGEQLHKVLYNSWEATLFNVDERSQAELAELAAGMGVELFVLDDGWFQGRRWDNAGLGDWVPDKDKFTHGLGPLIARVKALGMDFGLWVEPEMVNPDSNLYRQHPEWALHYPGRPSTEARNQLILNLGRADVQAYLIESLDRLLRENDIAFVKWDMNRNASEPGWPEAPGDPREVWVRYVHGLYRVWGELRARHPAVTWQTCSGGGGRVDLGILRLADQAWPSDNTEAAARLQIQEGFTQLFPACTMEAWVTDAGRDHLSLDFRFHVSMCGVLGVGGNLPNWSESERARAAKWIALYKEIRPVIQNGDLYRLQSPSAGAYSAVEYLSKDRRQGALFAFRTHLPEPAPGLRLRLQGLDPARRYTLEGFPAPRSGKAWMEDGLALELIDFRSTVRRIQQVD